MLQRTQRHPQGAEHATGPRRRGPKKPAAPPCVRLGTEAYRLDEIVGRGEEAIISVRGERRYVVPTLEHYNFLRECELDAAISESVEDHIKRITSA